MDEPERLSSIDLDLRDEKANKLATLRIVTNAGAGTPSPLIRISEEDAYKWCEQRIQLLEGCTYDYALSEHPSGTRLRKGVFRASQLSDKLTERGSIATEAHTGLLPVVLEREDGTIVASAAIEVRSSKLEYREQYREMLDYIAAQATDLLMELRSPAMLRLAPEPSRSPSTIGQQFAFLRSALTKRELRDAFSRILSAPHRKTVRDERDQDIRKGIIPSANIGRQLAMRQPRVALPSGHPLSTRFTSIPTRYAASCRKETTDTAENRFVKYTLYQYVTFLGTMERRVATLRRREDERLRAEIKTLRIALEEPLTHSLFTDLPSPNFLPLGSPVLQRRAGYREILQAWLFFNLAARLTWEGGDDVYASGKRNVAALYEYWLFFRLIELFGKKFQFQRGALADLIEKTSDGFGLKLKSGRHQSIVGSFFAHNRRLKVRFSYNRTFLRNGHSGGEVSYPAGGSWTQRMRPDYTLSVWPAEFTEDEAEANELMVHLHFDAKYRVDHIREFFGDDNDETLNEAQSAQRVGRAAKRDDLLKMHAYRDAIRRTSGAYVLYPGTENLKWREYHELLPNLGAFSIRPDRVDDGTSTLSTFIDEVMKHLSDRASLREQQSYNVHLVQSWSIPRPVHFDFPERVQTGERAQPITEQYALIVNAGVSDLPVVGDKAFVRIADASIDHRLPKVTHVLICFDGLSTTRGLRKVTSGPLLLTSDDVRRTMQIAEKPHAVLDGLYIAFTIGDEVLAEREWTWSELEHVITPSSATGIILIKLSDLAVI